MSADPPAALWRKWPALAARVAARHALAKQAFDRVAATLNPHQPNSMTMAEHQLMLPASPTVADPADSKQLFIRMTLDEARALFKPRPSADFDAFCKANPDVDVLHYRVYDAAADAAFDMLRFVRDR